MDPRTSRNYIPSRDEFQQLPLEILQSEAILETIEAEIKALNVRREAVIAEIAAKKQLCSPIRRMPAEMLGKIFEFCVEPVFILLPAHNKVSHTYFGIRSGSEPTIQPHIAPLLLTRVCWQWRSVAIGTPSIWRQIRIIVTPTNPRLPPIKVLQSWMKNSCDTSLEISVRYFSGGVQGGQLQNLMTVVQQNLYRVRRLDLQCATASYRVHPVCSKIDMPRLEMITMSSFDWVLNSKIEAPNLMALRCYTAVPEPVFKNFTSSDLLQEIELRFESISATQFFQILSQFPRLVHFIFHSRTLAHTATSSRSNITHHNLRFLSFGSNIDVNGDTMRLLGQLSLPSLRDLKVTGPHSEGSRCCEHAELFPQGCFPLLNTLQLSNFALVGSGDVFSAMVRLEELTLFGCSGYDRILALLARRGKKRGWPCPNLRVLNLWEWDDARPAQFTQIIANRGILVNGVVRGNTPVGCCPFEVIEVGGTWFSDKRSFVDMGISVSEY